MKNNHGSSKGNKEKKGESPYISSSEAVSGEDTDATTTTNRSYTSVSDSGGDYDSSSVYSESSALSTSAISEDHSLEGERHRSVAPPFNNFSQSTQKRRKPEPTFEEFMKYQQKQQKKLREFRSKRGSNPIHRKVSDQASYTSDSSDLSSSDSETSDHTSTKDTTSSAGVYHHHHHYALPDGTKNQSSSNLNSVQPEIVPSPVEKANGFTPTLPAHQSGHRFSTSYQSHSMNATPLLQTSHITANENLPTNSSQPSARLSLGSIGQLSSFSISANNSKAVLSALKSLQNKIKSLEEEVAGLNQKLEEEKKSKIDMKYELEQNNMKSQNELEKEKHSSSQMRHDYEHKLEQERKSCHQLRIEMEHKIEQEKKQQTQITHEWEITLERTKASYEQQIKGIEEKYRETANMYVQSQHKMDELHRNIVKAIKKKDKAETHATELDRALHDMVALHQAFVKQSNPQLDMAHLVHASRSTSASKKLKKKSSEKSKRNAVSRPGSAGTIRKIAVSRPRSIEKSRSISPGFRSSSQPYQSQMVNNFMATTASRTAAAHPKNSNNFKERYKKAAMNENIPFIASGTGNSFNVNGLVQKNLNLNLENEKKSMWSTIMSCFNVLLFTIIVLRI